MRIRDVRATAFALQLPQRRFTSDAHNFIGKRISTGNARELHLSDRISTGKGKPTALQSAVASLFLLS
jgi:hypothetical protein